MKLAEFSVKNYPFTLILFAFIALLGVSSLLSMPKSEDPTLKATFYTVVVVYPGTSTEDMENLILDPLEEQLNSLADIKRMISTADDGVATVRVEFNHDIDEDEKYGEVLREVNALQGDLPTDIYSLDVLQFTTEGVNIVQVALLSDTAPYAQLEKEADRLQEDLAKIKTLKKVETWAYPRREVQVKLDLNQLAQRKIPLNQVLGAIQSENANIPAGSVDIGPRKLNVKTSGSIEDLEELRQIIVQSNGQQVVRLSDIATVELGEEKATYLGRLNGRRGVFVTATQKKNTNIFEVDEAIQEKLGAFESTLPQDIKLVKSFDQAQSVSKRLLGLARDFAIAIVLVLITLLPLGIRPAVIVMISIPLSLAIGLAGLDLLGFGINQLSVVGLVISLGLLVDDAIVVVENIARFIRLGYTRKEAAIQATSQISQAVVGCTATLIFAFLPLTFLPESAGDFIRSLPMAVITTVLASLFISLTIVPFLASWLMPKEEKEEGNIFLQVLNKGIEGSYRKVLQASLQRPILTLVIAVALFGGSLALIPVIGTSVFPKSEKPQFLINVETPLGTTLPQTDQAVRWIEQQILGNPRVKYVTTNIGKGNPRIYYNVIPPGGSQSNYAQLFIQLQEDVEVPERTQLINQWRQKFSQYPGAKIKVIEFEQGPPVEAPLATRIYGENLDSLRILAGKVAETYQKTAGTLYVNNPSAQQGTDIQIRILRDKAGLLGIPSAEIDRMIRLGFSGVPLGTWKEPGTLPDPIIKVKAHRDDLDVLDELYVATPTGAQIPVRQLVEISWVTSPNRINHYDLERYTTVSAFVDDGYLTPQVNADFQQKLQALKLPKGYRFEAAGEQERQKETFGGLGTIILVAFFGILAVLILEFKTFKSSLIVLSVIPLGMIGAVGVLFLTGQSLSFTAIIGLIALAGIEVKNSILLVDYTNHLRREEGMGIDQAIEKAGETRFIPIVLTTLTAIGGLIPLVLEHSPLYSPLAWVIIGGLISSLILTRIVTPVMYKLLPPRID